MEILAGIRQFIGNYIYKSKLSGINRLKKTITLDDARKVGLVYVVTDKNGYASITEFIKRLQRSGKEVEALGFVINKDVPAFFSSSNSYSFFTLKDLNWYHKPGGTFINNFLKNKYDIVINLSLTDNFPLQYITGLSNAFLKVGKFGKDNSRYYDIMIETENLRDIGVFIEQITHYLSILKSKNYV